MPLQQHPHPQPLRSVKLLLWPVALALMLAACAAPDELTPGALAAQGKPRSAPWQAQLSIPAPADASRRLTEGEGEIVVASAIAAHEMRRP
jgi:hypothetical protein